MKLYFPILLVCLLALNACTKKELPQPVNGSSTIWMQCKMNNIPFEMNVGQNATYGTNISYINNTYKQFIFRIDATDLKKSFEVSINNYADTVGNNYNDLEQTIKPGDYSFIHTSAFPFYSFIPNEVGVSYTDKGTKTSFYSMTCYQTSDSKFTITAVKDVVENGKRYKLAEVDFSCTIQYKDGSNVWTYSITDGHCAIPFGGF
jgi:hypothetical protein